MALGVTKSQRMRPIDRTISREQPTRMAKAGLGRAGRGGRELDIENSVPGSVSFSLANGGESDHAGQLVAIPAAARAGGRSRRGLHAAKLPAVRRGGAVPGARARAAWLRARIR